MSHATLYYVHDPMCSWCYAYRPVFERLQESLPDSVRIIRLVGGLAPDSDEPMPLSFQQHLQKIWQHIEKRVPGIWFNYDFWTQCQPKRSTYPACRAVIAASMLGNTTMTASIQDGYYQQARNPSDEKTLIEIAVEQGMERQTFATLLSSEQVETELQAQISKARAIGVDSFPSLVLESGTSRWPIAVDYHHHEPTLELIKSLL